MQKAFLYIFLISVFLTGCTGNYTPRPYGYFRIELPEPHYSTLDTLQLPYSFEKSDAATIIARSAEGEKYWIDKSGLSEKKVFHRVKFCRLLNCGKTFSTG